MSRDDTHKKIEELTTLINVNNNRMMLHDGKIPQLDIDLLRKNAIELYEAINILHIQNLKNKTAPTLLEGDLEDDTTTEEAHVSNEADEDEAIEEEPKVDVPQEKDEPVVEEKKAEPATPPTPKVETVKEEVVEKAEAKPDPKPKKEAPKQEDKRAEKVNLYEKLNMSRIDSIKKSISISKRYEFQAALFKNDPDAYNKALAALDDSADRIEALDLLQNELKNSYNWEDEDPLFEELVVLVERKFG